MKIAFQFWFYKAVHPSTRIAELNREQWNEFLSLEDEYDRKTYIQWLFQLEYLDVRRMWCFPLDSQSVLAIKDGTKILQRTPTESEVIYRDMQKKYKNTTYGRVVLSELEMTVDCNDDLYKFVMYAHNHRRRFHICYYNVDEEPDKNKIIYIGELVDNTGYLYLIK